MVGVTSLIGICSFSGSKAVLPHNPCLSHVLLQLAFRSAVDALPKARQMGTVQMGQDGRKQPPVHCDLLDLA